MMGPCCSRNSRQRPARWRRCRAGGPRWLCWPRRCAGSAATGDHRRSRPGRPTWRASCANARSAWAGPACGTCRRRGGGSHAERARGRRRDWPRSAPSRAPGRRRRRERWCTRCSPRATADEQRMLSALISGELRQGAQAGLLADAIAKAAEVPPTAVRRALLLCGDLKAVAVAALTGGEPALAEFRAHRRPPARADAGPGGAPTWPRRSRPPGCPAAVDAKLDGIRIQVHRDGDEVGGLQPQPRRPHRAPARDRGRGARAARARRGARRRGPRASTTAGRPAPVPGDRQAGPARGAAGRAHPVLLRPAAPRRRRPVDEPGTIRWAALDETVPAELRVGRAPVVDRRARREPRSPRRSPPARRASWSRRPSAPYDVGRRGSALGQGQAPAHARPGRPRRRVGPRAPPGLAVQPAPGRAGPATAAS